MDCNAKRIAKNALSNPNAICGNQDDKKAVDGITNECIW
jgi:hypothetical protein